MNNNLPIDHSKLWLAKQLAYSRIQRQRIEKVLGKIYD